MPSRTKSKLERFAISCAVAALASCSSNSHDMQDKSAQARHGEYGLPHVRASDYRELGFAHGYAQAKDDLCGIELGMLGFEGQLSRYFGPHAPPHSMVPGAGTSQTSDRHFQAVVDSRIVESLVAQPPPLGPRDEARHFVCGYVEGFNRVLSEEPDVECADAEWLRPMTEMDVYRRVHAVTAFMSQGG